MSTPDAGHLVREVDGVEVVRPYPNKTFAFVALEDHKASVAAAYARGYAAGKAARGE